LAIIATVIWHLYLSIDLKERVHQFESLENYSGPAMSIRVNPFTNLILITIAMETPDFDEPFAALGASLGEGLAVAIAPGIIERQLNTRAREQYDLYSFIIPYRVRVDTTYASGADSDLGDGENSALLEAIEKREQRRQAEEQTELNLEVEKSAYLASHLSLENVRVGKRTSLGSETRRVSGTIVNSGDRTLRRVSIRVYFLDKRRVRIGEEDYHPVLVTDWGMGDNTPLRPNYREDFQYSLEANAPSGWAGQVEVEIVEIDFLESEEGE